MGEELVDARHLGEGRLDRAHVDEAAGVMSRAAEPGNERVRRHHAKRHPGIGAADPERDHAAPVRHGRGGGGEGGGRRGRSGTPQGAVERSFEVGRLQAGGPVGHAAERALRRLPVRLHHLVAARGDELHPGHPEAGGLPLGVDEHAAERGTLSVVQLEQAFVHQLLHPIAPSGD